MPNDRLSAVLPPLGADAVPSGVGFTSRRLPESPVTAQMNGEGVEGADWLIEKGEHFTNTIT